MKYRLVTLIGFVIAVTAIAVTSSRITFRYPPAVHETLVPRASSYLGVFESGPTPGSLPDYRSIEGFADMAGQTPNLAGYYSGWAEPFKMAFATELHQHGVIPYVQIDPSFAKVAAIADGSQDTYLKGYADSVRDFGHPVVIGFGHEMNGTWYSWGYRQTSPATFIAAWRHIVTVFRNEGADNVTWLWTVNAEERPGSQPIRAWWPGPRYVTWVGIDGYYVPRWDTFPRVFGPTISQVHAITSKPILLSETAVSPAVPNQFAKIENLFNGVQSQNVLGLVWFDVKQPANGPYQQNWQLQPDSQAQVAFREGLAGLNIVHP
jgi:Glycosyl hydrolase family 26